MALNASGPISLAGSTAGQSIAVELGLGATSQISLNDAAVRTLAGVPSGAIVMPTNFYGKANEFAFTISSNQTNANLATLATNAGWNGTTKVKATVGTNVYISSTSTGTPALTVPNSFPNGVEIINNGFIIGMGGNGGNHQFGSTNVTAGATGGTAINLLRNATITSTTGYIGGGGGGGGTSLTAFVGSGGGGAGGGNGGNSQVSGGSGGSVGNSGNNGTTNGATVATGGGGGRIIPGTGGSGGTVTSLDTPRSGFGGGSGGGGGAKGGEDGQPGAVGGGGGGWGASGGNGRTRPSGTVPISAGAGGSANNAGETPTGSAPAFQSSGGAGGKAVNLNGNTATFVGGTSRVYGAVS
jgi:hypothetical protein